MVVASLTLRMGCRRSRTHELHCREAGYVGIIGLVNSQILFANEVVKPHKVCVYQCPTHLATNQLTG